MKKKLAIMTASLLGIATAPAFANVGDTATYKFDLPAASSFSSGYPVVADLKITETALGVVTFELTPNWLSPGFHADSRVKGLDFVYQGPALTAANFTQPAIHGADIKTYSYETNPNNMDAAYKADDHHIVISWYDNQNDPNKFDNNYTNSIWTISGTGVDITDFTGTKATTPSGMPTPIFGIISVDPYSLTSVHPSTENWVSAVPEPETYAMLLLGLGLIGFTLRNQKRSA